MSIIYQIAIIRSVLFRMEQTENLSPRGNTEAAKFDFILRPVHDVEKMRINTFNSSFRLLR